MVAMVAWVADYLTAREREGRLYADEIVRALPAAPADHPLAAEWRLRADSADRLLRHLSSRGARRVVELGSGNGWLSAAIAARLGPDARVAGVEANPVELAQARRVFVDRPGLSFEAGDLEHDAGLPIERPDAIVLASAIQYVEDLAALVARLRARLAPAGELHILDSPLYAPAEVPAARERTRAYYEAIGVPAMAANYRHHTWDELAPFRPRVAHRPGGGVVGRAAARLGLRSAASPFPWLIIAGDTAS
jgi:SAM-dependent methyltransferase